MVVILRHKRLIILGSVGTAIAVVFYSVGSLLLPPEKSYLPDFYTPTAHILILGEGSGGLSSALSASGLGGLASLAGVNVAGSSSSGELAVFLAKSASSLDELSTEFDFTSHYGIKADSRAAIRSALLSRFSITFDGKTGIVSISFKDIDPGYAHRVVNRLVEILDRRFAALGGNKAETQKTLLEQKLAEVQNQMSRIERDIKTFQVKYGVLSVEALATEQISVLARMRSELILKDMSIENYEKFSNIEDPVISRLRSERGSIQAKILELERGGSVLPSQGDIPKISFEYAALQRDLLVQIEIFKILTQQYELAKLDSAGQEAAFQVIELAEVSDQKSGPSRSKICLVATMAAFLLTVFFAFLLEAIKRIRNDPEAMSKLRGGEA